MFSGEAVFAPGIPRNKPEQGSPAGGDVFDGCVVPGGIYDRFHFGFMVFSSFQHRFCIVFAAF
jgi:hypothetical protein